MRPGLWSGFFLEEKAPCTLENLIINTERLRNAGFECGELDERNAFSLFVSPCREEAERNAMAIGALCFYTQLHAPKPILDEASQDECEDRILSACSLMGIRTVVTHPYKEEWSEERKRSENLRLLGRFTRKASSAGIRIALENQIYPVDITYYLDSVPALGVNLDFAHAIASGQDIIQAIDGSKGRLYGLHVSDSDGRHEDYHIMPGRGITDWRKAIDHIIASGYDGDFHLEIVHERSSEPSAGDRVAGLAFRTVSAMLNDSGKA